MKTKKEHKKLRVWHQSMDLVDLVYSSTRDFPPSEKFGLRSQLRRAAISIPMNIAEGYGRKGRAEYLRYLNIAFSSLLELETGLEIANRQGLIKDLTPVENDLARVSYLLTRLSKALTGS